MEIVTIFHLLSDFGAITSASFATLKYRLVSSHKKQRPFIPTYVKPHVKIVLLCTLAIALDLSLQGPTTGNPLSASVCVLLDILVIFPNLHLFGRDPTWLGRRPEQIKYPHA